MSVASFRGMVRGGSVVLDEGASLPEGMGVLVTPLPPAKGSPRAILAALKACPPVSHEAAEELRRLIKGRMTCGLQQPR